MRNRLTLIPIAGLVLLSTAGCGTVSSQNGTNAHQGTNATTNTVGSKSNVTSRTAGSTDSTVSNSGNTANSVEVSVGNTPASNANYASELALIRKKGYTVKGTTPNATVKTSSGATLSAWLGVAGGDVHNQFVFFFLGGKYLGTDTAKPSVDITSVSASGNGVAVTYPVYRKNGFFAQPSGTPVTITYAWNGSKLVPNKPYPKQAHEGSTATQNLTSTSKVQQTLYKDSSAAASTLSQIQKSAYLTFTSNNPLVHLGLGISAKQQGALGHAGLQWKEGHWIIEVLWGGENQGGTQLAKNIVVYLHTHTLPVPNQRGIIMVKSTDGHSKTIQPSTLVAWQEGNKVYHLKASGDPVAVLERVVNAKLK